MVIGRVSFPRYCARRKQLTLSPSNLEPIGPVRQAVLQVQHQQVDALVILGAIVGPSEYRKCEGAS